MSFHTFPTATHALYMETVAKTKLKFVVFHQYSNIEK